MKVIAGISYLPIVGWFFSMFIFPKTDFTMYHAKQGFGASIFYIVSIGFVWFASHSIPSFLSSIELSFFVLVHIFYLLLLLNGFVSSLKGKQKPLPLFGKKVQNWYL